MRVLYFTDNGSDHNRRFIEKIRSFGHEIWFLDFTGQSPTFTMPPGVTWLEPKQTFSRDVSPNTLEGFLPELQSWLRKLRPEILHAGPVQTCGYLAARSGFRPLIVMSWGADLLLHAEKNAEWKHATEVALRAADGFACDCEAVRSATLRYASFPASHIAQFPWGMQRGVFSPIGDRPSDWSEEPGIVTFLCTRSWEPLYDMDILLEAFAKAHSTNASLRLLLLGDGSLRTQIHRFIEEHKLAGVVSTRGEIPTSEMPKWFRAADVYVSCAKSDGTSISLLEAMATRLPVVVSDIPSNREWVTTGDNGWLARVGSSDEFADRLLRAASLTAEQAKAMGERSGELIAQRADWDKNFPLLMNLYEVVAASPRQACANL
jgi:glycosyltransferase involved in cell wall biosynthesis